MSRVWTIHEQALAACHGEDDTSSCPNFNSVPNPDRWEVSVIKVSSNMDVPLPNDQPFVCIQMTETVVWSNCPGFTGGTRKLHHYQPLHIRLTPPGPQPKLRPAYSKFATNDGEGADKGVNIKRPVAEDAKVGMPAKKRRIDR